MSTFGIDYAWSRPSIAAMRAAKVEFVCRYLSWDTTGKNLTRGELAQLIEAGFWIVVVWETSAKRALSGYTGGKSDAQAARVQAAALGMPPGRPIYFAADWDAGPDDHAAILNYLDGAAAVIGRDRVGLYSGYGPMKAAFDADKIAYGWQTYAWSEGRWDRRAQLQQYSNDQLMGGAGVDFDRGMTEDYGQWKPGEEPVVPLSDKDIERVAEATAKAVWTKDGIVEAPKTAQASGNMYWKAGSYLFWIYDLQKRVDEKIVDVAGAIAEMQPTALADAIVEARGAEGARLVADLLRPRTTQG